MLGSDRLHGRAGGMRYLGAVVGAVVCALVAALVWSASPARANRLGPPWLAEVVDEATVYDEPDGTERGRFGPRSLLAVTDELEADDGTTWYATPNGWVVADEVTERTDPFVAEVAVPRVSVHARPWGTSKIRRTASEGDLVRVTGLSPGMNGDDGIWWATTEGYVPFGTLRSSASEWARRWALPDPSEARGGWWGAVRSLANVRAGATFDAPVVGTLPAGTRAKVLAEEAGPQGEVWYRIDGGRYAGARVHAGLVERLPAPRPSMTAPDRSAPGGMWLVVDRDASTLTLVRDGRPEMVTYVSLGEAGMETPDGTYGTIGKFQADDMSSANVDDDYRGEPYDLPNVPFTQYYKEGGYALHGTYWHDDFGTPESHGCINLTWTDAAYLFGLTSPSLARGEDVRWTELENATPVVITD